MRHLSSTMVQSSGIAASQVKVTQRKKTSAPFLTTIYFPTPSASSLSPFSLLGVFINSPLLFSLSVWLKDPSPHLGLAGWPWMLVPFPPASLGAPQEGCFQVTGCLGPLRPSGCVCRVDEWPFIPGHPEGQSVCSRFTEKTWTKCLPLEMRIKDKQW